VDFCAGLSRTSVSLSVMQLCCANVAELIGVLLGVETGRPKQHCVRTESKDSMRPSPNYFGHLLVFVSLAFSISGL